MKITIYSIDFFTTFPLLKWNAKYTAWGTGYVYFNKNFLLGKETRRNNKYGPFKKIISTKSNNFPLFFPSVNETDRKVTVPASWFFELHRITNLKCSTSLTLFTNYIPLSRYLTVSKHLKYIWMCAKKAT